MIYYNEINPGKAEWLRQLMRAGAIAEGDIDERSIADVRSDDLHGYAQCHFFAGVGVWSYALRLAGWPDDEPVWTASCPCQPFSAAGKRKGTADERHLWPILAGLVRAGRPPALFGEQVSSPDGLAWLDDVFDDLEAAHYTPWALDTCAPGVGAPHIRQRLYWGARLADTEREQLRAAGRDGAKLAPGAVQGINGEREWLRTDAGECGKVSGLADYSSARLEKRGGEPRDAGQQRAATERDRGVGGLEHATHPCPVNGFWAGAGWVLTRPQRVGDPPSLRPVKPRAFGVDDGTAGDLGRVRHPGFPLAQGEEARVLRLKGYGDAIVAPQAAAFVRACIEEWSISASHNPMIV